LLCQDAVSVTADYLDGSIQSSRDPARICKYVFLPVEQVVGRGWMLSARIRRPFIMLPCIPACAILLQVGLLLHLGEACHRVTAAMLFP
jgi:hypothetical protein